MVTVDNLDDLEQEVGQAVADELGERAVERLRQDAPADWNVEPIAQSLTITPSSDGFLVTFNHPEAGFVEFGTSPHTITADEGETLAFEVDGEMVFAKSVSHPGMPAINYVSSAIAKVTEGGL
jgi:hypothetical protein